VQPRKVRIIADEIRGKNAEYSASLLRYHTSKSARALRKILVSAMANAVENHNLSPENLRIATIMVDEGPRLKRIQARAMGRANRIIKKTSHITVIVEDYEGEQSVRPHGTKAKPRPTFKKAGGGKKKKDEKVEAVRQEALNEETLAADTTGEEATPTDTVVEEQTAAPEEATPVTEADQPEQEGGSSPEEPAAAADQDETTAQAEGATGEAEASDEEKGAQ
jgi:large subunit ribosomal protein L22